MNLDDPHFAEDCFEVDSVFASQFGMKKRRRLKPGSVPTIFHQPSTTQVCTSEAEERLLCKRTAGACRFVGDEGSSSKIKRGAAEKRERREV